MSAIIGEVLLELGAKYLVPFLLDQVTAYVTDRDRCDPKWTSYVGHVPPSPSLPAPVEEHLGLEVARSRNVLSWTPGRVRLRVPGVHGNPALARELAITLGRLPGVRRVHANPLTGNALITYDPTRLSLARLEAAASSASPVSHDAPLPVAG